MIEQGVFQFRIILQDVNKPVWRCIQISNDCSFWDLHVAIQDAMGWKDSHLHEFQVMDPRTSKREYIGIPVHEDDVHATVAGWDLKVRDYLKSDRNHSMSYLYDFGDHWEHLIEFDDVFEKRGYYYPVCLAGAGACPPEDVGGVIGYEEFLLAMSDPTHEAHERLSKWAVGKYDFGKFYPERVKFTDPKERWQMTFADSVNLK